ncbi:MAG: hypothetical protein IPP72_22140 [Chitinophagaceae bacterium]|nr:hypothetical protein [Chitinophagaceae bacterium]
MHPRKILIFLFVFITAHIKAQHAVVDDLAKLTGYDATDETVFVRDLKTGGTFVHLDSGVKADGGVVLARKAGGFWVRHFDKSQGVNPCWWGAKGDAVHNDLPALNAATAYCLANQTILQFPSGIFRITGQWVIGGKTINEKELFAGKLAETASFNMDQHRIARSASPLIVKGSVRTCIYGDFSADTLTAIIYYNIRSMGAANQPSAHLYTHEFSNIGIYGKGYFSGTRVTPPSSVNMRNKQIGLVILFCSNSKIDNCSFFGLRYGLVFKTAYFGSVSNCNFELCHTGICTRDYNSNLLQNITGVYCKLLLELTGSQLIVNNLNAEFCESTLSFKGGNVMFNGIYCENYNLKLPNKYQLSLGSSKVDPVYNKRNLASGIIMNSVAIATGGRDAILLEDDVKQVNINGGSIFGNIVSRNEGNTIVLNNVDGVYKMTGPGKLVKQ